jgi:hypothetical protein
MIETFSALLENHNLCYDYWESIDSEYIRKNLPYSNSPLFYDCVDPSYVLTSKNSFECVKGGRTMMHGFQLENQENMMANTELLKSFYFLLENVPNSENCNFNFIETEKVWLVNTETYFDKIYNNLTIKVGRIVLDPHCPKNKLFHFNQDTCVVICEGEKSMNGNKQFGIAMTRPNGFFCKIL